MKRYLAAIVFVLAAPPAFAQESKVVDSMDDVSKWKSEKKEDQVVLAADAEAKEGKAALRINAKGRIYAIAYEQVKPDAAWNDFDGFAFWVKGDGSENFAEMRIQAGKWDNAWVAAFPLRDAAWHEVRLAWADLVPTGAGTPELGTKDGFKPGDISLIAFGKSWNFNTKHQSPGITFSVDDLRVVKGVKCGRARVPIGRFPRVAEVVKRMKAGEAVTVLALGDSITWGTDVEGGSANAYPAVLGEMLRKHYGSEKITVVSRAIGGSTTAKGREWLERDVKGVEADLITIMFGFNEMPAKPEQGEAKTKAFTANLVTYAQEAAGVMKKPPALVLLATIPGMDKHWETLDGYAEGVRELGRQHPNITVADVNGFFKKLGKENVKPLMAGEAHPNKAGQRELAKVVFEAITGEKAPE